MVHHGHSEAVGRIVVNLKNDLDIANPANKAVKPQRN
jgi:hypothetical protein